MTTAKKLGAPRVRECLPKLCVQCRTTWIPEPHEHTCKRCGPCRSKMEKNQWVKCTECGKGMSLRPAAYWERYHATDWICGWCKRAAAGPAVVNRDRQVVAAPCGHIYPVRAMTRCAGFNPTGDGDGCPRYEHCLDLAAKRQWEGFGATTGNRSTQEWKYVDDFAEFFEYLPGRKLGYK
jgi:hypothetical protein